MERHHHQQQQHQSSIGMEPGGDRVPQWSFQETKEFLTIRAELDQTFMETKRNKLLWEVVSTKMKEKGYLRSSDQCKCKWKNLVTRYKGSETIEADSTRQQFPFYNELETIFTARMQRMLWLEAEGGASTSMRKKRSLSDDEDDNEDSEEEKVIKKKRKVKNITTTTSSSNNLEQILQEFMRQQMQMELQWRETIEMREKERRMMEMEWRQRMEDLERERLLMDKSWRDREEQRMMREEARAEKRDALITALLNKLRREDHL